MKSDFEKRLQNDLFPNPPASFTRRLTKTLEAEGVKKRAVHPFRIAAMAVGIAAAAASMVLVLLAALHTQRTAVEPLTSLEPTAHAQATDAPWSTAVYCMVPDLTDGNIPHTQEQYAQSILGFLRTKGESEPEELWILGMRPFHVPQANGDGYRNCVLVVAQHDFGDGGRSDWGGTNLYCFSEDGCVLWGTEGVYHGPAQAAVSMEEQEWHFLFGQNPPLAEPGIPMVTRGAIVGSEPGTDIVFSMFRSHEGVIEQYLQNSSYQNCLQEYFLVTVSEHDWTDDVKNSTLQFDTIEGPYELRIANEVPTVGVITASDAAVLRAQLDALQGQTPAPDDAPVVRNLTALDDETSARYTDAILTALQLCDVEPNELWLCAASEPALDPDPDVQKTEWRDTSIDRQYLVAQYEFEGECGPELFYYQDNRVLWMTRGYEPYDLNLVHDTARNQTIVFGASCAFDGKPLPMAYAAVKTDDADWNEYEAWCQLPLATVKERVKNSRYAGFASEFFLLPMKSNLTVLSFSIEALNGQTFTPTGPQNELQPVTIPLMAIEVDGRRIPGTLTHFCYATELTEQGVINADGMPISDTLDRIIGAGISPDDVPAFSLSSQWSCVLDSGVTVRGVKVYSADGTELLYDSIEQLNNLPGPNGTYYVCFECVWQGSPIPDHANLFRNCMDLVIFRVYT